MLATATREIITDANEAVSIAEYSLILSEGEILGRLRFPPGIARTAIKEFIASYRSHPEVAFIVIKQHCIGDDQKTTGWSTLIFLADLKLHQFLYGFCRKSNLRVVNNKTAELMDVVIQLEAAATKPSNDAVDEPTTKAESSETPESAPVAEEPETETSFATLQQLTQLTMKRLRELAAKHHLNIRVKRRAEAEEKLIPQLLGVVAVEEIA